MKEIDLFNEDWRERYRVRIGFFFGVLFLWRVQPRNIVLLGIGLIAAWAGILLRQWSAGCVKKMDELATTGPYAIVRHPLYLGSFLAGAGFMLAASSFSIGLKFPWLDRTLLFWCFLWILIDSVYRPKILREEAGLKAKFPGQYEDYEKSVPRLFPSNINRSQFNFSTFSWELWKKNEEYWSIAGYAVIAIILLFRYRYK